MYKYFSNFIFSDILLFRKSFQKCWSFWNHSCARNKRDRCNHGHHDSYNNTTNGHHWKKNTALDWTCWHVYIQYSHNTVVSVSGNMKKDMGFISVLEVCRIWSIILIFCVAADCAVYIIVCPFVLFLLNIIVCSASIYGFWYLQASLYNLYFALSENWWTEIHKLHIGRHVNVLRYHSSCL